MPCWSKRLLVTAGIIAILAFLLPRALTGAARWLMRHDALARVDIVIALGGDPRCLREHYAAELYRRGLARKIVVSGIPVAWGIHTADAARQALLHGAIPTEDILALRNSWNTRLEATDLTRLMRQREWTSALIVTSPFHSRRALYTFENAAPDLTFISVPLPAESPEWQPQRWWTRRGDAGQTVREFLAWGNTLLGGWR